jgi:hypothetical protein
LGGIKKQQGALWAEYIESELEETEKAVARVRSESFEAKEFEKALI